MIILGIIFAVLVFVITVLCGSGESSITLFLSTLIRMINILKKIYIFEIFSSKKGNAKKKCHLVSSSDMIKWITTLRHDPKLKPADDFPKKKKVDQKTKVIHSKRMNHQHSNLFTYSI